MCALVWGVAAIYHNLTFKPIGQIAFVCRVNNPAKKNDITQQICRVNADGSDRMQLTHNQIVVDPPSWSPDGAQIVFSDFMYDPVSDARYNALFVMNADGSNLHMLTLYGGRNPVWLPDGQNIAFVTSEKGRPGNIIGVIELGNLKRTSVYVNDLSAKGNIRWSPNGKQIALTTSYGRQVDIANADGSFQTHLTNISGGPPAWSPGGKRIAFGCSPSNYVYPVICITNPDGSQVAYIVASLSITDYPDSPTWSPDGNYIGYNVIGVYSKIWVVKSDGSQPTQVTYGDYDAYPAWRPQQ